MSWWNTLFDAGSTAEKVTDAVISTGDKLFYTDEEKADDRRKQREFFPKLLEAYAPFKIAQRILAIWFSFLFGLAFLIGLFGTVFNVIKKFQGVKAGLAVEDIPQVDIKQIFDLVVAFELGWIMMVIVAFYFAGGTVESFKKK